MSRARQQQKTRWHLKTCYSNPADNNKKNKNLPSHLNCIISCVRWRKCVGQYSIGCTSFSAVKVVGTEKALGWRRSEWAVLIMSTLHLKMARPRNWKCQRDWHRLVLSPGKEKKPGAGAHNRARRRIRDAKVADLITFLRRVPIELHVHRTGVEKELETPVCVAPV